MKILFRNAVYRRPFSQGALTRGSKERTGLSSYTPVRASPGSNVLGVVKRVRCSSSGSGVQTGSALTLVMLTHLMLLRCLIAHFFRFLELGKSHLWGACLIHSAYQRSGFRV